MARKQTPEGALLRLALDWLKAEGILAFRMNTGAMTAEHHGKRRFMRFGTPGQADIVAFLPSDLYTSWWCPQQVVWLELKAPDGRQSELQKSFQQQVESHGHVYEVCRSLEDVQAAVRR